MKKEKKKEFSTEESRMPKKHLKKFSTFFFFFLFLKLSILFTSPKPDHSLFSYKQETIKIAEPNTLSGEKIRHQTFQSSTLGKVLSTLASF